MIDLINRVIEYLENNLKNKIDKSEVEKQFGYSFVTLNSYFFALCGVSILDYHRKRRLSDAILSIIGGESVITLAQIYGYGEAKNFSRAIFNEFKILPSEAKTKLSNFELFEKIVLKQVEYDQRKTVMSVKKIDEFELFGLSKTINLLNSKKEIANFYAEIKKGKYSNILKGEYFAVLEYLDAIEKEVKYFVGTKANVDGLESYKVKKCECVVFEAKLKEDMFEFIHNFRDLYKNSKARTIKHLPEIEHYTKDHKEFLFPLN